MDKYEMESKIKHTGGYAMKVSRSRTPHSQTVGVNLNKGMRKNMSKRQIENNLNRKEVKNIRTILKKVNESGMINKLEVYGLFKSNDIAINILRMLNQNGHINIISIYEGDGIYAIRKTDNTFDGIGYYSSKTPKHTTLEKSYWIVGIVTGLVLLYEFVIKHWLNK